MTPPEPIEPPSKSQVDKAGARLRHGEEDERSLKIVEAWRALHQDPMQWVTKSVQGRTSRVVRHVVVAQRLKRRHQILAKLRRESTRLAQMQDIGGCRVIIDSPAEVVLAANAIESRTGTYYSIAAEDDYREQGRRGTGYRALHLVVEREGRQIEIQLRTLRQHAWAEAVERTANRSGYDLKGGKGPPEILEFFRLASDGFKGLERKKQPSRAEKQHLRALHRAVLSHLRPVEVKGRKPPAKLVAYGDGAGLMQWLIIYDWQAARFVGWMKAASDVAEAARQYATFERRYRYQDGYEVVLVGADSIATIRRSHSHYFGKDPNDLDPHGHFLELMT